MSDFKMPEIPEGGKKVIGYFAALVLLTILLILFGKQISAWIRAGFAALADGAVKGLGGSVITDANVSDENFIGDYVANRNSSSPFAPDLYTNNPDSSTMTFDQLVAVCKQITDASVGAFDRFFGKINGDEDAMVNAFKNNCQNQVDVSNLGIVFKQVNGVDLLNYLSGKGDGYGTGFVTLDNANATANLLKWISNLPIA